VLDFAGSQDYGQKDYESLRGARNTLLATSKQVTPNAPSRLSCALVDEDISWQILAVSVQGSRESMVKVRTRCDLDK